MTHVIVADLARQRPRAARRRLDLAARRRSGARARRHARSRRRRPARAQRPARPSGRVDRSRHRRSPHARPQPRDPRLVVASRRARRPSSRRAWRSCPRRCPTTRCSPARSCPWTSVALRRRTGGTLGSELDRGTPPSRRFFGAHIDPSTAMPGPLDTPSLDALRTAVRTRLVVDGGALEPYDGGSPPPARPPRARSGEPPDDGDDRRDRPGLQRFLRRRAPRSAPRICSRSSP